MLERKREEKVFMNILCFFYWFVLFGFCLLNGSFRLGMGLRVIFFVGFKGYFFFDEGVMGFF